MTLGSNVQQQRKPQNQIVGRNLSRTARVKKELLQALLEEQSKTQAVSEPPKEGSIFERMLKTIRNVLSKR